MRIRLEDIPPEGLEINYSQQIPESALPGNILGLDGPLRGKLALASSQEGITLKGNYQANIKLLCSRCLAPLELALDEEVDLVFMLEPPYEPEKELNAYEAELGFCESDALDLTQALLDELNLALPMAPLCEEQCKGLCPSCGSLLRQGQCTCAGQKSDPRWAKLAQLKQDK